ncbi:hypothetical protein LAV79_27300 [Peribacillus butanolivorans]|uniref:hypothetical protein n=1 Tax=Peribacillus butanolivorans TaxID=421767 RepID=UPI0030CA002E
MKRNNTVILNEVLVGLYYDKELDRMLNQLSDYYQVDKHDFTISRVNPNCYNRELIT